MSIESVNRALSPSLEGVDVAQAGAPTKIELFLLEVAKKMRSSLPEPFASLSDPFLVFLHFEMNQMALNPETRQVLDPQGKPVGGYSHFYHYQEGAAAIKQLKPMTLKGVWIPKEKATVYATEDLPRSCPLVRSIGGKEELLFIIHPESEALYDRLLDGNEVLEIAALPLSSLRTMVVAIGSDIAMVKVSLDKEVGGVKRLLGVKECANSVINTTLLKKKCPSVEVMSDPFSFIPEGFHHGMIYREIPSVLNKKMVVPLYSLFGLENEDFFLSLLSSYPESPTNFVTKKVLEPIATLLVHALFDKKISLQAHGQNLMMVIDPNSLDISYIYRDMGGVNALVPLKERETILPKELCDERFFYTETHVKDAADVLEDFTFKVLFNLEKQFVKQNIEDRDPQFANWRKMMELGGYISNWTLVGKRNNDHERVQKEATFYRYGYFSKIFGEIYLTTLSNKCHLFNLTYTHPELSYDYFIKRLGNNKKVNPNYNDWWFHDLIQNSYKFL